MKDPSQIKLEKKVHELEIRVKELESIVKCGRVKKRLYCLNNRVICQTPADYRDEIEPTVALLAYEKKVNASEIYVVEI